MHAICALDFILHCPCSDIYSNESTKLNFNFPGLSGLTIIRIQDLQELENEILKFYDFPSFSGPLRPCKGQIIFFSYLLYYHSSKVSEYFI